MYMQCMPYPPSAASHLKCLLPLLFLFLLIYACAVLNFYFKTLKIEEWFIFHLMQNLHRETFFTM
jgi:hypothetical protein